MVSKLLYNYIYTIGDVIPFIIGDSMAKDIDWFSNNIVLVGVHICAVFVFPVLELFHKGADCAADIFVTGVGMLTLGWTFIAVANFITNKRLKRCGWLKWPLRVAIFLFVNISINVGTYYLIKNYTELDPQSCERNQ